MSRYLVLIVIAFAVFLHCAVGEHSRDSRRRANDDRLQYNFGKSHRLHPPRFKHPSGMIKMEMKPSGSSITLKCYANGNPTPNITWYKNKETPIRRQYFEPSYGKWTMTLQELTKGDDGNYTCTVCNTLGCIEHTLTLLVQERFYAKPSIEEGYPGNHTVSVGETVVLKCPIIKTHLHSQIFWVRRSTAQILESTLENMIHNDNPESLTLYNVTKMDEGWYSCVAINSLGNTTAIGYVTVLEPTRTETVEPQAKEEHETHPECTCSNITDNITTPNPKSIGTVKPPETSTILFGLTEEIRLLREEMATMKLSINTLIAASKRWDMTVNNN